MSTYVLVPGGWHGGWWFRPVADALRAHGHDAHPVTLTGLGERRHLASASINLDTHIDDLVGLIEYEDLTEVVLVAHSYGGLVAAGAVEHVSHRIAAVVALDAQIPRDGESLWSLTIPEHRAMFGATTTDGWSVPPPPGLDPRTTPHPFASFLQPIRLTRGFDHVDRKIFVHMAGWEDGPVVSMYERVRDDPGWASEVWPTGHDVVGEAFEQTVALLLREAG